jgi:hypothetical protein
MVLIVIVFASIIAFLVRLVVGLMGSAGLKCFSIKGLAVNAFFHFIIVLWLMNLFGRESFLSEFSTLITCSPGFIDIRNCFLNSIRHGIFFFSLSKFLGLLFMVNF